MEEDELEYMGCYDLRVHCTKCRVQRDCNGMDQTFQQAVKTLRQAGWRIGTRGFMLTHITCPDCLKEAPSPRRIR